MKWEETYGDQPCGVEDCPTCDVLGFHGNVRHPIQFVFEREGRQYLRVADALMLFDRHPGWKTDDHKDCLRKVHKLGRDGLTDAVKAFLVHVEANRKAYPVVGKQERAAVREWQKVKRILKARLSPRWISGIAEPWRTPLREAVERIKKLEPFETSIRRATKSGPLLGVVTFIVKGLCEIMREQTGQPHHDLVRSLVCKFFPDEVSQTFEEAQSSAVAHMERTPLN